MYMVAHVPSLLLLPLVVAALMVLAGVQKRALEWKRPSPICPACDREASRCRCRR
jgi:hypothetical protein